MHPSMRYRECACGHMGITHENLDGTSRCDLCGCRKFAMYQRYNPVGLIVLLLPVAILLCVLAVYGLGVLLGRL